MIIIPNMMGKIFKMFQTINQLIIGSTVSSTALLPIGLMDNQFSWITYG